MAATIGLFILSLIGVFVLLMSLRKDDVELGLVTIETSPPGATVYVDGENVGAAPARVGVPKHGAFTVLVDLDGYEAPAEKSFQLDGKEALRLPTIVLTRKE